MTRNRTAAGIGLLLGGLPFVWVVRWIVGLPESSAFTSALLVAGTMLIWHPSALLTGDFWRADPLAAAPLLFLAPAICSFLVDGRYTGGQFFGMVFSAMVAVGMLSLPKARIRHVRRWVLVAASLSSVTVLLATASRGTEVWTAGRVLAGTTYSPNQVAFSGALVVLAIIHGVARGRPGVLWRLSEIVLATAGILVVALARSRSAVLGLVFCAGLGVLLWARDLIRLRRGGGLRCRLHFRRVATLVVGTAALLGLLAWVFVDTVDIFARFAEAIRRGATTYFGGAAHPDASALIRQRNAEMAFNNLTWSGRGPSSFILDFPLLQSVRDLGAIGGLFFFVTTFALPVFLGLRALVRRSTDENTRFMIYVAVFFLPSLFLHGRPYDYSLWLPLIAFYGVVVHNQRQVSAHPARRTGNASPLHV